MPERRTSITIAGFRPVGIAFCCTRVNRKVSWFKEADRYRVAFLPRSAPLGRLYRHPSGRTHGSIRHPSKYRSRYCTVAAGTRAAKWCRSAGAEEDSRKAQEDSGGAQEGRNRGARCSEGLQEKEEKKPQPRRPKAHCRGRQAALGSAKSRIGEVTGCPASPNESWRSLLPASALICCSIPLPARDSGKNVNTACLQTS